MTSHVYVIADLHLGHRKLQEIRGIGDDEIINRWNERVTSRDVVYVLGDVFRIDRVPELRGTKKLILGNHDQLPMTRYLSCFSRVGAMHRFNGALLTHIPIHPNQRHRYRKNIHGHLHEHVLDDDFYICVSAEQVNYTPVLLSSILP